MNLISIGKFSRLTGLSIRALRLYNTESILEPSHIDPDTGYRYYTLEQIEIAEQIKLLRECEMPLDNILAILKNPENASQYLLEHRQFIENRWLEHRKMLLKLDRIINDDKNPFLVTFRTLPSQSIVCISQSVIWAENNQRAIIGQTIGKVYSLVRSHNLVTTGAAFCTYPVPWRKRELEIRACIPVAKTPNQELTILDFESGEYACTIHYGDYDSIPQSLERLLMWLAESKHELIGDVRETFLDHPLSVPDPSQYRTELAIPIKR